MDTLDTEKLLGATVRDSPHIHGLYLQEPHQVLMVKSQDGFPPGSGRGGEEYLLGNIPRSISIMKASHPEKILYQNLIQSGEKHFSKSNLWRSLVRDLKIFCEGHSQGTHDHQKIEIYSLIMECFPSLIPYHCMNKSSG